MPGTLSTMGRQIVRRAGLVASGLVVGLVTVPVSAGAVPLRPSAPTPSVQLIWSRNLDQWSLPNVVAQSSPVEAFLGGPSNAPTPDVVVGDRSGNLFALDLATGHNLLNNTPVLFKSQLPIDSPPSSTILPSASYSTVFVGLGNRGASCSSIGGYLAVTHTGGTFWHKQGSNPVTDTLCAHSTVMSGITLAALQGGVLDAVAPSLGQGETAFTAATGTPLKGWNFWYQADSSVSTPAVARLNPSSSTLSVIEGGDSTAGLSYGVTYQNGGHVRIIKAAGNGGTLGPGGTVCSWDTYANGGQIVESSPAVGNFLPKAQGTVGIASGMGYYPGPPTFGGSSNTVFVLNSSCQKIWRSLTDYETDSPILADVTGSGKLDVIVGTQDVSKDGGAATANGSVYAFDAATGQQLWHVHTGAVIGSPVAADLTGSGYADVVVNTVDADTGYGGTQIIDGKTGAVVWRNISANNPDIVGQNSPLITADPNGTIGLTIAGYAGELPGSSHCPGSQQGICLASEVAHYELPGSSSTWLTHPLTSWLEFHHDTQLSGNVNGPGG